MTAILIKIDTNGQNAGKFKNSIELFDLIYPIIVFLIDDRNKVYEASMIDWAATRPYFQPDNNGHCIYLKGGGYVPAYCFESMAVYPYLIGVDGDGVCTLSELCEEVAKKNNIDWIVG